MLYIYRTFQTHLWTYHEYVKCFRELYASLETRIDFKTFFNIRTIRGRDVETWGVMYTHNVHGD